MIMKKGSGLKTRFLAPSKKSTPPVGPESCKHCKCGQPKGKKKPQDTIQDLMEPGFEWPVGACFPFGACFQVLA